MKKTIEGPNEDRHEKTAEKSKMDKTFVKKMDINGDEERWNDLNWPSKPLNCCRAQALGQQATHVQGRQWNCTTRALQRRAHGLNTGQRTKHKEMSWCSKIGTNPCELEIWWNKQDSSRMPRTQMFAYSNLSAIELESKEHWKYIGKHCNDAGWFCKVLWPDCEDRRGQSQIVDAWETKGGQPETEVPKTMGNNWMEFEEAADSIAEWWEIEPWADGDNWTHRKHLRRLEYKDKQLSMWLGF